VPFPFTGKINKVTLAVDCPRLTPEDERKLIEASRTAQDAK
jgi:arylsulfatase